MPVLHSERYWIQVDGEVICFSAELSHRHPNVDIIREQRQDKQNWHYHIHLDIEGTPNPELTIEANLIGEILTIADMVFLNADRTLSYLILWEYLISNMCNDLISDFPRERSTCPKEFRI